MSTEYVLLERDDGSSILLAEESGKAYFGEGLDITTKSHKGFLGHLTADEVARMAVEMLKVASYLDPDSLQRTAKHLGEKDDWRYYHGIIRDLL